MENKVLMNTEMEVKSIATDMFSKKTIKSIEDYYKLHNKEQDEQDICLTNFEKMVKLFEDWNIDSNDLKDYVFATENVSNTFIEVSCNVSKDYKKQNDKNNKKIDKIDEEIEKYKQKIMELRKERENIENEIKDEIDFDNTLTDIYNELPLLETEQTEEGEGMVKKQIKDYLFDGEIVINKISRKRNDILSLDTDIIKILETNDTEKLKDIWVAKYDLSNNKFNMIYPANNVEYNNLSKFIKEHYRTENLTTNQQPFKSGAVRVVRKSLREKKKSNDYKQGTNYLTDLAFLKNKTEYENSVINDILINKD